MGQNGANVGEFGHAPLSAGRPTLPRQECAHLLRSEWVKRIVRGFLGCVLHEDNMA
jgi:hypothetical protein